jgi:hypothetical protein
MKKPNLFIVGAPKCGTTFLYEKLKEHPDVFFPKIKELNHFSYDELKLNSYYKDFKINSRERYLEYYKAVNNERYIVDASVSYFNDFVAHEKIIDFNKDARIIIMFRDPIKRAFSHYKMDLRMGYANLSFLEYLKRKPDDAHFSQYVKNSMYGSSLKNFLKYFDIKNICILNLDEIESDFSKLLDYLKLDVGPTNVTFNKINANKTPSNIIAKYLQYNRNITSILKLFVPYQISNLFKRYSYSDPKPIQISEEESKFLIHLLREDQIMFKDLRNKFI